MKRALLILAAITLLSQPFGCGEDEKQKIIDRKMKIYMKKLKSSDESVRVDAADMLGNYGDKGEVATSALAEALSDSSAKVRGHAARALGKIGPKAADAMAALKTATGDKDGVVRVQAAAAMMRIDPETTRQAMPVLIKAMKDPLPIVRSEATGALALVGDRVPGVVGKLIDALADSSEDVRIQAAVALGKMGPKAKSALPALGRLRGAGGELGAAVTDAIRSIRK